MPAVKVFRARSTRQLLASLQIKNESLLLAPTKAAADEFTWSLSSGSVGIHRMTLAQLATQIAGNDKVPVTPLVQESLIARAVDELRRKKQLGYFAPIADTPGFVRSAAATIHELRLNFATPDGDLALIAHLYDQLMQDSNLADLSEVFQIAAQTEESPFFGLPLFLLDIPVHTQAERIFLNVLIQKASSVTAFILNGDDETPFLPHAEDIDEPVVSSIDRVRKYLFSSETLASAPLDDTLQYFSAPGESFECIEIARRIQRSEISLDRIAVVLRHPNRYQPLVEEAFRRAGIPCWFSTGTVRPDPSARAFLALLRCALEQYSASRFAEYLSLGQMPGSGEQSSAPFAWEQFIVDAAVIGGPDRWERRLAGLAHEFQLQEQQNFRVDQLEQLRKFAVPMIQQLTLLPHNGTWGAWIDALIELAHTSIRNPDGIEEILAELEPMREIGPVSLEEVETVLSERLGTLRRESSPRRFGQVFVGTMEEVRGRHFDLVFLPGLAEGLFPQRAQEDPLLLDEARKPLGLPTQDTRFARERLRLRIAAASGDRLVVSYPRMDTMQSRARVPSFYAFEVVRAAIGQIPGLQEFEDTARAGASVKLGWPAPDDPQLAIDDTEYDLAILAGPLEKGTGRYMLEESPILGRSLRSRGRRWRAKWYEEDGLIAPLEVLNLHRLSARTYSATALQRFSSCPYQFALHSIFHLRLRKQPITLEQLDPQTRGTLIHEVQRIFFEKCSPWTPRPIEELLELMDQTLNETAESYYENLAPAIDRVWESEIEGIRTDLRGWIRETLRDPEWIPRHFEHEFEQEVHGVKLRGKIDVIEEHATRGVLRITDFKTGKPPRERVTFIGGGTSLQPLLYAKAFAQESGKVVEKGRLFYATQRGGYQQTEINVTEIAQEHAINALQTIDQSIERGFLVPAPAKDCCKNCDYQMVCGPYEEIRVTRKSPELLAPLAELRRIP